MRSGVPVPVAIVALVLLAPVYFHSQDTSGIDGRAAGTVDSRVCAGCHSAVYETYRQTAMARSFYPQRPENVVEDYSRNNRYYHKASDTYFLMFERGGRYYQRRYQIGFGGREANVDEKQIDFVMGSGDHARSYLHRTSGGSLVELPIAWYAEKGGYWAMSPGYDRADQPNAGRKISYECMFCHNAYPVIPQGSNWNAAEPVFVGALPEGIDCQRCHGPGARHVQFAQTLGATAETIRNSIMNPAHLEPTRQMEICMQCHLETTSFPFPHSIRKYDRGPFSYVPGQPLGDFSLSFDRPASPGTDRFEIVSSVYRLRMSACFLKSSGKLRCTTCHDPHRAAHDESGTARYTAACLQCHTTGFQQLVKSGRHTSSADCVGCHMPKRRTDDVVHAVMTDHYIQRRPPERDLLADKPEPSGPDIVYHGPVVPYYPAPFDSTPENELYLALAQVRMDNNLADGVVRLTAAVQKYQPRQAEFYIELGDALQRSGKPENAVPLYDEALRREPNSLAAWKGIGSAFERSGQLAKAVDAFRHAIALAPRDALLAQELGQVFLNQRRKPEALAILLQSVALDREIPQTHQLLGTIRMQMGDDLDGAEASYREAIRLQPDNAQAHTNLAILLFQKNRLSEAAYHFDRAVHLKPDYAYGRFNYGLMLVKSGRTAEAREQLNAAVQAAKTSESDLRQAAAQLLSQISK